MTMLLVTSLLARAQVWHPGPRGISRRPATSTFCHMRRYEVGFRRAADQGTRRLADLSSNSVKLALVG